MAETRSKASTRQPIFQALFELEWPAGWEGKKKGKKSVLIPLIYSKR